MIYFAIVKMTDNGEHEILDGYDDIETADEMAEKYAERYPHAYIDVHEVNAN